MRKKTDKNIGHFVASKAAIDMHPLGNRANSAHEPEHRQFHVARGNGTILNTPSSTLRSS